MKLKIGQQFEYDFDRGDAEVVVPLILLIFGLTLTPLNKVWLLGGVGGYYFLYFFLKPFAVAIEKLSGRLWRWWRFRCPYCKSREIILQGYQGYHSDEQYAFHLCNGCRQTSVLVNEKLIKASRRGEAETT